MSANLSLHPHTRKILETLILNSNPCLLFQLSYSILYEELGAQQIHKQDDIYGRPILRDQNSLSRQM